MMSNYIKEYFRSISPITAVVWVAAVLAAILCIRQCADNSALRHQVEDIQARANKLAQQSAEYLVKIQQADTQHSAAVLKIEQEYQAALAELRREKIKVTEALTGDPAERIKTAEALWPDWR